MSEGWGEEGAFLAKVARAERSTWANWTSTTACRWGCRARLWMVASRGASGQVAKGPSTGVKGGDALTHTPPGVQTAKALAATSAFKTSPVVAGRLPC